MPKGYRGGILLMMLVIFGMFMLMMSATVLFINRQFHQTVDQEQEQRAFQAAEGGVQYALFLLNNNVKTTAELVETDVEHGITHPESDSEIGAVTISGEAIEGVDLTQGVVITVDGQDSSLRRCQRIVARLDYAGQANAKYVITDWEQRRCSVL